MRNLLKIIKFGSTVFDTNIPSNGVYDIYLFKK